jgi:hypothetical protein
MKPQKRTAPEVSLLVGNPTDADRKRNDEYFAQAPRDRVLRDVAAANIEIRRILAEAEATSSPEKSSKQ